MQAPRFLGAPIAKTGILYYNKRSQWKEVKILAIISIDDLLEHGHYALHDEGLCCFFGESCEIRDNNKVEFSWGNSPSERLAYALFRGQFSKIVAQAGDNVRRLVFSPRAAVLLFAHEFFGPGNAIVDDSLGCRISNVQAYDQVFDVIVVKEFTGITMATETY